MNGLRVFRTAYPAALVWLLAAGVAGAHAAPLTTGNILVIGEVLNDPTRVREFTPSGALVQVFTVPSNPPGDDRPRDLVVDRNGNVQIYNGTFSPVLTTLHPASAALLNNTSFPGWSTANNISFGGIAAFGDFVFVTDMTTANVGAPNGIIRFNVNDLTGERFASGSPIDSNYIDVTIGRDGLLYGQSPGGSPSGFQVDVFDPITLAFQRRIELGQSLRAIAVDENGDLFSVSFNDDRIFHFDRNGNLLRTVNPGVGGFTDIDIDGDGRIVAAAGGGLILLTDRSLASFTTLSAGATGSTRFVAWVQPPLGLQVEVVPEPGSLALLALGAAGLGGYAWRRKRSA